MFREIFSDAERVGAGPVLRLTNALLTAASRFWQLESLYLSNEKYLPRWSPRLICYSRGASLAQVLLAAGTAEGFLPAPRPWTRVDGPETTQRHAVTTDDGLEFVAAVRAQEEELLRPALPERRLTEQERIRRGKLADHHSLPPDHRSGAVVSTTGRVMRMRDHGGVVFADLQDGTSALQVMLCAEESGEATVQRWRRFVDLGDHDERNVI